MEIIVKSKTYGPTKVLIDDDDYELVKELKLKIVKGHNDVVYVAFEVDGKNVRLHRYLMGVIDRKIQVDHINHNGCDNRRDNLRVCCNAENARNSRKTIRKCTSQYKGVSWSKIADKWNCQIKYNYKRIFIGYFDDEIVAAKAYDQMANYLFHEFADLNFPNNQVTDIIDINKILNKKEDETSKYVGVFYFKKYKKWISDIVVNYKKIRIGTFNDEYDAAKARDKYIIDNNLDTNKYKLNFESVVQND